jgi:hypothetical protein
MIAAKTWRYNNPVALSLGLNDLRRQGLTPRGLLFAALDASGEPHLAVPSDVEEVTKIRVGDKLTLDPPWQGRYFYFDSLHRLPDGGVVWNGDRRLKDPGTAHETATVLASFLKHTSAKNVFLGCTPHQPGSWWVKSDQATPVELHLRGIVDVVSIGSGLLARKMQDPDLYYLPYARIRETGNLEGWQPLYRSPLGNILMLERRVLKDRLALTCEQGLIEVDLARLPLIEEKLRIEGLTGFGVIGRVDGGAFAVTVGTPQPWGLESVKPALLVGAEGDTLVELAASLRKKPAG